MSTSSNYIGEDGKNNNAPVIDPITGNFQKIISHVKKEEERKTIKGRFLRPTNRMTKSKPCMPCKPFNGGSCKYEKNHLSNSKLSSMLHICSFCFAKSGEQKLHPESQCAEKEKEDVKSKEGSKFTLVNHNVFPTCSCRGGDKACDSNGCTCFRFSQECGAECGCSQTCANMGLTRGEGKKLRIGESGIQGSGCFAEEDIVKGNYIGEYTGELVLRADQVKKKNPSKFLFEIGHEHHLLDAERFGSKLAKMNHLTEKDGANALYKLKQVNGVWRVGVWADKDIKKGEEIFANYSENYRGHGLFTPPKKKSKKGRKKRSKLEKVGTRKTPGLVSNKKSAGAGAGTSPFPSTPKRIVDGKPTNVFRKKLTEKNNNADILPDKSSKKVLHPHHLPENLLSESPGPVAASTPSLNITKKSNHDKTSLMRPPGTSTLSSLSTPKRSADGKPLSVTIVGDGPVIRDLTGGGGLKLESPYQTQELCLKDLTVNGNANIVPDKTVKKSPNAAAKLVIPNVTIDFAGMPSVTIPREEVAICNEDLKSAIPFSSPQISVVSVKSQRDEAKLEKEKSKSDKETNASISNVKKETVNTPTVKIKYQERAICKGKLSSPVTCLKNTGSQAVRSPRSNVKSEKEEPRLRSCDAENVVISECHKDEKNLVRGLATNTIHHRPQLKSSNTVHYKPQPGSVKSPAPARKVEVKVKIFPKNTRSPKNTPSKGANFLSQKASPKTAPVLQTYNDSRLPPGWYLTGVIRKSGVFKGKFDIYIHGMGKQFRSMPEIVRFYDMKRQTEEIEYIDYKGIEESIKTFRTQLTYQFEQEPDIGLNEQDIGHQA